MRILIYCLAVFLCACGNEATTDSTDSTADNDATDHVLKHQVQALEKAKGVEQTMQDAAQRRLEEVDSMSNDDG